MIPDALREAIAEYRARPPFQPPTDGYQPGDLWVADYGTGRCIVAIACYDSFHVDLNLTHSTPEFASDIDIVYDADVAAPWPVVACGELNGQCMWEQLVKRVGRIPAADIAALQHAWRVDEDGEPGGSIRHLPHGHPWRPSDRGSERWQFVSDLLTDVLTPLRSTALRQLIGDA